MNHHHRATLTYIADTKALADEARWDMLRGITTVAEWREENDRFNAMIDAARAELFEIAMSA